MAENLASPPIRPAIIGGLGKSDPLIGGALQTLVDREFLPRRRPTTVTPAHPGRPGARR